MKFAAISAALLLGTVAEGAAQEFYSSPDQLPQDGPDKLFLDACWKALRASEGLHIVGTEAVMVPQYRPLTASRMDRYQLTQLAPGMQYADTTFITVVEDAAGVTLPLAMRCEMPFDPATPDYSGVILSEDKSLNPNIPPEDRPLRD